jgi:L-alanine-DL-glutamate epimerase-like enolase superfamily enzyme
LETAGEYSTSPVEFRNGHYTVPTAPGLGVDVAEPEVRLVEVA